MNIKQCWAICSPRATFMRPSDQYIIELMFIVNSEMKFIEYFQDCFGHTLKHTLGQR